MDYVKVSNRIKQVTDSAVTLVCITALICSLLIMNGTWLCKELESLNWASVIFGAAVMFGWLLWLAVVLARHIAPVMFSPLYTRFFNILSMSAFIIWFVSMLFGFTGTWMAYLGCGVLLAMLPLIFLAVKDSHHTAAD